MLYRVAMQFRENRQSVAHTDQVLTALQSLLSSVEEAETSTRVYVLTGDPSYLAPYQHGLSSYEGSLEQIRTLTEDSPSQEARLTELRPHVETGMRILRHLVELRRDQGMEAVLLEVEPDVNRREAEKISNTIATMRAEESRLLEQRRQKYDASVRRTGELFAAGIITQFGLLWLVCFIFLRDASYRARAAQEIAGANVRLAAILATTGDGIYQLDQEGRLVYLNPAGEKLLGYRQDEIRGRSMHEIVHDRTPQGEFRPAETGQLLAVLGSGVPYRSAEAWYQRNDGTFITVECTGAPIRIGEEITGAVFSFHDITERKLAEAALRQSEAKLKEALTRERSAARVDFLTGILNRRGFYEIAGSESQRSRRYKRPLSLVYVDLDNFKGVNDSMGHDAGDELLTEVAAVIHSEVRGTDTVGRLGGDEFAVLLPETDQEQGRIVVDKVQKQLLEAMQQKNWPVTFSIGLISFQTPPESIDEMVRGADKVMYSVKLKGKNSVAAYEMA